MACCPLKTRTKLKHSDLHSRRLKQRHAAKRIFERLRAKHGYGGSYMMVKDYVRLSRAQGQETYVPLSHLPRHAQADFGEAVVVIGGVRGLGGNSGASSGKGPRRRGIWGLRVSVRYTSPPTTGKQSEQWPASQVYRSPKCPSGNSLNHWNHL
jgi:hypothetical protein